MKKLIGLLLALSVTACSKVIDDYVNVGGDGSANPPSVATPSIETKQFAYKLSPGALRGSGNTVSIKVNITPTRTRLVGSSISARVGFGKSDRSLNP